MNATCRKCGLPIAFSKNARGRYVPTNPDGTDHFDICRQKQFEVVKTEGKPASRKRQLRDGRFEVTTGYEHAGRFIGVESHYEDKKGNIV